MPRLAHRAHDVTSWHRASACCFSICTYHEGGLSTNCRAPLAVRSLVLLGCTSCICPCADVSTYLHYTYYILIQLSSGTRHTCYLGVYSPIDVLPSSYCGGVWSRILLPQLRWRLISYGALNCQHFTSHYQSCCRYFNFRSAPDEWI
ncbi:hypothetical protein AB205_0077330 [Aquarana catesbeiana]|uniref:Uncharacterized protein n=1 Tax=Aquarana catesbeiana TaxID=8400 RepID=A0A2G9S687_AQUCT|nr:hypothetical protein AB205_0077330 [Aquarana catesbeiana]